MKSWLLAILIIFSFQPAAFATGNSIDIVFDIDWTTFYSINADDPFQKDKNNITVEGKVYRATDHLAAIVETLLTHPEVRINFFSGGEKSRNEALLKSVRLSDGRTLLDVTHRLYSRGDLLQVSQDETLKFSARYKKVLAPDWNPERTILIDDQPEFAKQPLKAVSSLGRLTFQNDFNSSRVGETYFPANREEWRMERDKALLWLGMIDSALTDSKKNGRAFATVLQETWYKHSTDALFIGRARRLLAQPPVLSCQKVFGF